MRIIDAPVFDPFAVGEVGEPFLLATVGKLANKAANNEFIGVLIAIGNRILKIRLTEDGTLRASMEDDKGNSVFFTVGGAAAPHQIDTLLRITKSQIPGGHATQLVLAGAAPGATYTVSLLDTMLLMLEAAIEDEQKHAQLIEVRAYGQVVNG